MISGMARGWRRGTAAPAAVGLACVALACVVLSIAVASAAPTHQAPTVARAAISPNVVTLTPTLDWTVTMGGDTGCPIAQSSPVPANLDGQSDIVVGDRSGEVYGLHVADGTAVRGWPQRVPGAGPCNTASTSACPATINISPAVPVDSTPSVSGPPGDQTVYVGSGNAACFEVGGYQAFRSDGSLAWYSPVTDPGTDPQDAHGVQASLTVAPLAGGGPDVVAGSLDQEEYALVGTGQHGGDSLPGWPFFTADSVFSTAAVGDLYGTGHVQIVEGGDSSAGFGQGQAYGAGGHLRILTAQGGQVCRADTDQTIDSSPAIGGFLAGGATGIVTGTGGFYAGASTNDAVRAYDTSCHLAWSTTLDGDTFSSPALADLLGNGRLEVAEGTDIGTGGGSVWVLDAASGAVQWHQPAVARIIGSVTTADLTGSGHQDLLVPTINGVEMMDGITGQNLGVLSPAFGFQNSPLVTDDPDGNLGITIAGYNAQNQGVVRHYELPSVPGTLAGESGAWPMFHHDAQLTGDAGFTPARGSIPVCQVPSAVLPGYDQVGADGGVFSFGSQPFCGSTGGHRLNAPVVGIAQAPLVGGYWAAASDGGVFAYGGAHFFGSMGAHPLNKPIVAIAATLDGRGYWLVASDGGIFAFGDASFHGSLGSSHLNAPIVGIAPTADGGGYRMVAGDGGVFTYGDAQYFGSLGSAHLSSFVTGIADDVSTGGYWIATAAGQIYSFATPFFGPGSPLSPARPVIGIGATSSGDGYRLVGSDGGLFAFGDARFFGSVGGKPLVAPVVGLSGP
jgi:hypothetical protein